MFYLFTIITFWSDPQVWVIWVRCHCSLSTRVWARVWCVEVIPNLQKRKKKKRWDQNVMSSPFCVLIIFVSFVEEPNHLTHAISCLYYFICIGTSWVSMSYLFCLQLVILEDGVFKISNSLIIVWSLIERTLPLTRNSSFWTITSFLGSSYVTVLENLKLSTIRLNILLIHLTIWWLSKMILENSMLYFP